MIRPRPPIVDRLGRVRGARWRGRLVPPAHCHPLVRELWTLMNRHAWLPSEIAQVSGLSVATIKGWGRDRHPNLATFEAAVNTLGYELRLVPARQKEDA